MVLLLRGFVCPAYIYIGNQCMSSLIGTVSVL